MRLLYACLLLLLCASAAAQVQTAYPTGPVQEPAEGAYPLDKKIREYANGLSLTTRNSPEDLEEALARKMAAYTKTKAKSLRKGLLVYEAVIFPEITANALNYYARTSVNERGDGRTTFTLFLSPGNDNFLESSRFPKEMQQAAAVLKRIDRDATLLALERGIAAAQAELDARTRELLALDTELQALQKEHDKLQQALQANQAAMTQNQGARQQVTARQAADTAALAQLRTLLEEARRQP